MSLETVRGNGGQGATGMTAGFFVARWFALSQEPDGFTRL
jgi:hypothetical protein